MRRYFGNASGRQYTLGRAILTSALLAFLASLIEGFVFVGFEYYLDENIFTLCMFMFGHAVTFMLSVMALRQK